MKTAIGIALLVLLALVSLAGAKQQLVPPDDGDGGGLRICWCEVDPEGRIGAPVTFTTMRNGQGRIFVKRSCAKLADPGFRSPG